MAVIPEILLREGSKTVMKNGQSGMLLAQEYARQKSGPHGKAYWKRISGDPTGIMSYEYGPHGGGLPVGAGWRHGPGNTDLPRSADVIGPKFAKDIDDMIDDLPAFRER